MRVLYIDNQLGGHHQEYLKALTESSTHGSVVILPAKADLPAEIKQYVFSEDIESKNFAGYRRLISFIKQVADNENIDVIHFLNFDPLLKYFGVGLKKLRKYSVIATFHHYRYGRVHDFSRKRIYKRCKYGVVHTKHLKEYSDKLGISNCVHIEYPVFKDSSGISAKDSRAYWHLNDGSKVLLALGGTRRSKGLDLLLEALDGVNEPFQLLIAGSVSDFDKEFVESKTSGYRDKVKMKLCYLTDKEVQMAAAASDIVVLPYRKVFDGASGPLGEGVILGKCIIGPDHGSLGRIISENHLGYTFESENIDSLHSTIISSLTNEFVRDEKYKNYQVSLDSRSFVGKYEQLYK